MANWFKCFVHNCVVHPLLPFLPVEFGTNLHDHNANWAFGLERYDEVGIEHGSLPERWWVLVGYEYQHEDTGVTGYIDRQQLEWGFLENNPRLQLIGPIYRPNPPEAQAND